MTTPIEPLEPTTAVAITTYTVFDDITTPLPDSTIDSEPPVEVVIPWTDYSGTATGAVTITPGQATVTEPASVSTHKTMYMLGAGH